ncbi:MAG: hypothetical protein HOP16_11460 [Acidobacteria bacterium]|nr:hypothetical protein [Acidobacteriota bacterium]
MRKLLVAAGVIGIVGLGVSLLAQSPAASAAPQGRGGGAGNPLGQVGALGQEVKRPPLPTGPAPRLPDGTIDLNGLWNGGGSGGSQIARSLLPGETMQLLPAAKALMDVRAQNEADDPHLWCMPMGVPRSTPYPFRFVQNYTHKAPTHMFILHEGNIHSYRQIFMDGRKHPAEIDPTWFGHSIGWYEGKDTLVIDTVGFNDKFWFDRAGTPHTEQLHTIEKWTRPDMGRLVNTVTIDDPGAFAKPFTVSFPARLSPPGDEIMEYICQENNQFGAAIGQSGPSNK